MNEIVRTYVRVRYFAQPKKRKTLGAGVSGGGGGSGGGRVERRGWPSSHLTPLS